MSAIRGASIEGAFKIGRALTMPSDLEIQSIRGLALKEVVIIWSGIGKLTVNPPVANTLLKVLCLGVQTNPK